MFLEPLNLHSKDVVVLAVNDNSSSECAGGSHWYVHVYQPMKIECNVFVFS